MTLLFHVGFLPISFKDIIDILLVGYLIFLVYKILRGSIALNIVVSVILIYVASWIVNMLEMKLLSTILTQLVNVGVLLLIIVFQPEIRRFLIFIGKSALKSRTSSFFSLFQRKENEFIPTDKNEFSDIIINSILTLKQNELGGLIVFSERDSLLFENTGTELSAKLSEDLIVSVFEKRSPLHDGALIVQSNKLFKAGCVLPVSNRDNLPSNYGLRHRSALGVNEQTGYMVLIVSEESGRISICKNQSILSNPPVSQIRGLLNQYFD